MILIGDHVDDSGNDDGTPSYRCHWAAAVLRGCHAEIGLQCMVHESTLREACRILRPLRSCQRCRCSSLRCLLGFRFLLAVLRPGSWLPLGFLLAFRFLRPGSFASSSRLCLLRLTPAAFSPCTFAAAASRVLGARLRCAASRGARVEKFLRRALL